MPQQQPSNNNYPYETQEAELSEELHHAQLGSSNSLMLVPQKIKTIYTVVNNLTYLISASSVITTLLYIALTITLITGGIKVYLEGILPIFVLFSYIGMGVVGLVALIRGIIGCLIPKNNFSVKTNYFLDVCFILLLSLEAVLQGVLLGFIMKKIIPASGFSPCIAALIVFEIYYAISFVCIFIRTLIKAKYGDHIDPIKKGFKF
ncbi:hypothetical protein ABK040_000885 [Willaertia magna]